MGKALKTIKKKKNNFHLKKYLLHFIEIIIFPNLQNLPDFQDLLFC